MIANENPTIYQRDRKYRLPRSKSAMDALIFLLSTPLAYLLSFDGPVPESSLMGLLMVAGTLVLLKFIAYFSLHLSSRSWIRVAFRDLGTIALVMLGIAGAVSIPLATVGPMLGIPRSIALIDALLTIFMMAGLRALARYWYEDRMSRKVRPAEQKRVLLIGAGEAGSLIARELVRHPEIGLKPLGFLDDDPGKQAQRVATVPVLGDIDKAEEIIRKHRIDQVLISMPSEDGRTIRNIVGKVQKANPNLSCKIIPGMYELLSGRVAIQRIRDVGIDDLLGRPPVKLDVAAILNYLQGKTVMITGAGGSIGSELVRQICRFHPKELILFGHGENSIYQLERELDRDWPDIAYHSVIGAIQNGSRLEYIFKRHQPRVVFHAAAHKHVPLMELNPEEAVFNNIIGSRNLIELALKYGVSHFVNISTDKAVNPTSVMGASKRVVELLVQNAARKARKGQIFVSVRFGNVLGSRGSVIPVFKQQIRAGGPVTVTHPDMVRYFMTIPEASQLVLQASGQGRNGEIYILDMGKPVRILDLARDLIRLSGFEPEIDIPITFSGMRPGEKLYEELMTTDEKQATTPHEKIFVARCTGFRPELLERTVRNLQEAALASDHLMIRRYLEEFVRGCKLDYSTVEGRAEA